MRCEDHTYKTNLRGEEIPLKDPIGNIELGPFCKLTFDGVSLKPNINTNHNSASKFKPVFKRKKEGTWTLPSFKPVNVFASIDYFKNIFIYGSIGITSIFGLLLFSLCLFKGRSIWKCCFKQKENDSDHDHQMEALIEHR